MSFLTVRNLQAFVYLSPLTSLLRPESRLALRRRVREHRAGQVCT